MACGELQASAETEDEDEDTLKLELELKPAKLPEIFDADPSHTNSFFSQLNIATEKQIIKNVRVLAIKNFISNLSELLAFHWSFLVANKKNVSNGEMRLNLFTQKKEASTRVGTFVFWDKTFR